ncbi:MAG: hypothetical protein U0794_06500 [Isosphaeraceae bacterium]
MFEPMLDTIRKTTESNLRLQQQMMKPWWNVASTAEAKVPSGDVLIDQMRQFQKQLAVTMTEMFQRHRETVDAQYGLGIQVLEEAFRVSETRDPAEFLRRAEELCKHGFDCVKAVADDQAKGFQAATESWLGVINKGAKVAAG